MTRIYQIVYLLMFLMQLNGQDMSSSNQVFHDSMSSSSLWQDMGYALYESSYNTELNSYNLEFSSQENRKVIISMINEEIISVKISRETTEDPGFNYEGGHYSFNLSDWLRKVQIPYDNYPFYLDSYAGSLEVQLQSILTFLNDAFYHSTLEPTMRGAEWGYFPSNWNSNK